MNSTGTTRLSTGLPDLDNLLGGGLLRGSLTVVVGATGIGKTQLGLAFANAGLQQDGQRGVLFDMATRGDSQNHVDYASRLFDWTLTEKPPETSELPEHVWDNAKARFDYTHIFRQSGRRVTKSDLDPDDWKEWKVEMSRKLQQAIAFFYGNFAHGVRRCLVDGIEPTDRASDSWQLDLFEYIYHQVLRKDHDWVARDLFRERFRQNAERVSQHAWDQADIGCLLMYTAHDVMLDDLLERPIESGDLLSNANTIILMGKTRYEDTMGRALHIAKHRGSACDDRIVPYTITNTGLQIEIGA
jgi:KaiC/GvpD/RAD55 family RecA-like ATPase